MTIPNTPPPDELAAVRAEMERLKKREAELRALLIANPDIREGAAWLAEIKVTTHRRTDLTQLRAMYPEQVAEHTWPTQRTSVELHGITEDGEIVSARAMRKEASQ